MTENALNQVSASGTAAGRRRNRGFDESHRELLETAAALIAEAGEEALSLSALARKTGLNRSTIYYHFKDREALVSEVVAWSSEQISAAFSPERPQSERIDHISRFVLSNPVLIKLWIDQLLGTEDIREQYPHWDELVAGIETVNKTVGGDIDAEVYSTIMLVSAIIGPRVFKRSVQPAADDEMIVKRFRKERQRMLSIAGLLQTGDNNNDGTKLTERRS